MPKKVGGSSILDEYQANSLLDVAPQAKFQYVRFRGLLNNVGSNQTNAIIAMLPRDIIQLSRIALRLMIVWLAMNIGWTIVGTFK
jgi:hypothetical protein